MTQPLNPWPPTPTPMTDYERDQEEVQAERRRQAQFPPYTTREQLLNQILALHDWYRDNPDEPMPRMIIASSTTRDEGTNDEPERVCAVVDFANQHEAEIHETWGEVTARLRLFTSPAMDIVIRRSTALDTTVGRYLR